ncbi:hypothetical protein H6G72_19370 [Planktothricoides sp. FACHB-1370]|uniref:Glycosyltransferase RgtA/B/C/D-like domain-containing protein n=2 Tax=Planktothricoides raciborskii TaxID=132608 RepID=A0ABR8EGH5_9CYAN|nr:hypothetical protein [Planktothricoides raciborskii FACHB-1370]MBD2584076.1 hypothetical protein [Planktothricoides raciborskii FACHB-1261]
MKLLKHEFSILLIILGLFLLINLITVDRFTTVWLDEVMFTDPAINLYFGNGFTSTAWFIQTKEEMWAGNLPLYSLVLFLWVKLFGFSLLTVRSLNYFLIIGSTIMLWLAVIRLRLVNIAWIRIFLIIIFISGYGISLCYRSGRYDCLGIMLGISALFVYSVSLSKLRYFFLMLIGILIVPSGLQVCLFAVIICFLLLIFLRKSFVKEACFMGFGIIIGLMILLCFYYLNGVLDDFISSVNSLKSVTSGNLPKDPSLPFLYIAALLIIIDQIIKSYIQGNSPIIFGILAGLFVPIIMLIFGRFPTYYSWMVYIPLSVVVCSSMEIMKFRLKNQISILILISLLLTCMVGWPLQIASAVNYWNDRDYERIENLVVSKICIKTGWSLLRLRCLL